mmetsp:Transcript_64590/g.94598  ORF Transcript_64590/g.94598 Transcript_64590/m.94598 type:complete len:96 (+) Transcript_64590:3-290(+)
MGLAEVAIVETTAEVTVVIIAVKVDTAMNAVAKEVDMMTVEPVTVTVTVTVEVITVTLVDGKALALTAGAVPYRTCVLYGMTVHGVSAVQCIGST